MRGTQRRVGDVIVDVGQGEGGASALFVIADVGLQREQLEPYFHAMVERDHVVRASLLRTDVELSAPLAATAAPAQADMVAMVESTHPDAAFDAASAMARQLHVAESAGVYVFQALWRLGA